MIYRYGLCIVRQLVKQFGSFRYIYKPQTQEMRQSQMQAQQPLIDDDEIILYERPAITNTKLCTLILLTYGLIVAIYALSQAIEHVRGNIAGGYQIAGAIILTLFIVYVAFFCTCWYCRYGQREQMKRDVVQKALAKERALQAKQNLE